MSKSWTEKEYDSLHWHDVHVHAFRIVEGEYGSGQLWLDLDYILEWICSEDGSCRFRIAPAVLVFREATHLKLALDYESGMASLSPFSLDGIEREIRDEEGGYQTHRWTLRINWPEGEISFQSPGFRQQLTGPAVETRDQRLEPTQRSCGF